MPKIRTTIEPEKELDVSEAEAFDLECMGLVLSGTRATTPDGLRAAAERQVTEHQPDSDPTDADTGAGDTNDSQEG